MTNDIIPTAPPRVTEADLCGWLGHAVPGDVLEYHRGYLALDASAQTRRLPDRQRRDLAALARRVIWAAEHGLAIPVQRRHGAEDYSYLLIARRHRGGHSFPLSKLLATEAA